MYYPTFAALSRKEAFAMIKKVICWVFIAGVAFSSKAQSTRSTQKMEQLWFGYHNQLRLTNKWELLADVQLRTRDNFVDKFSQSILRMGLSWYLNTFAKFSVGYAFSNVYTSVSGISLTQPEHRPWQQFQWEKSHGKSKFVQRFRLEERFKQKILNDTIVGGGYHFNFRIRYNVGYEIPLSTKRDVPKSYALVLNDDININAGKEIVYNYFDQNRFFVGIKYQFDLKNNLTAGYMNLFQQTALGNKYVIINAFRFTYVNDIDLRKKGTK